MKPDILYLSHCAPTIPDKGERIRAFYELQYLAARYRVHLAGFARDDRAFAALDRIRPVCASAHLERIYPHRLARKGLELLRGDSLTASFYRSPSLESYVRKLASETPLCAAVAFSSVMAPYSPDGLPLLLDMIDVDSEKWFDYSRRRWPGWLFRMEGRRLQQQERGAIRRAGSVILTTDQEAAILRRGVKDCRIRAIENGVDFAFFDPSTCPVLDELAGRRYLVIVGAMGYFPNADGADWFAREVFPGLRESVPGLEFLIVGHNPPASVRRLSSIPGVSVPGYVPDVRPYVAQSLAVVAPLRIARGVQNKVLEGLAMGKPVLASAEIGKTFGDRQPLGLRNCRTLADYREQVLQIPARPGWDPAIRADAAERFSWERKMDAFDEELRHVMASAGRIPV